MKFQRFQRLTDFKCFLMLIYIDSTETSLKRLVFCCIKNQLSYRRMNAAPQAKRQA
nr:MAG TPA: hypothetical protein [Caudoviricetes sp.]